MGSEPGKTTSKPGHAELTANEPREERFHVVQIGNIIKPPFLHVRLVRLHFPLTESPIKVSFCLEPLPKTLTNCELTIA